MERLQNCTLELPPAAIKVLPDEQPRWHWWSLALALPLAAVLLYSSLRGVNWSLVWQAISHAHPGYLALGAGISSGSIFLRALRWRVVLNAAERFSVGRVFCATAAGYMGNNFLPARAGEIIRSVMISSGSSLSKTYVLTTALTERLMDAIALVLFGALALLGMDSTPPWIGGLLRSLVAVAGAGALALVLLPRAENSISHILLRLPGPPKWRGAIAGLAGQCFLGLRAFHNLGRFATFASMTLAIWGIEAFCVMLGGRALGMPISFPVAVLVFTGLGLSSALPSTPGYVGIYQFIAINVLTPFGFSRHQALAYILLSQAMAYGIVTFWGVIGIAVNRRQRLSATPKTRWLVAEVPGDALA